MDRPRTRQLSGLAVLLVILLTRSAAADPALPDGKSAPRFLELLRRASPLAGDLRAPAFRAAAARGRDEGAERLDRLLGAPRTLYLSGAAGKKLEVPGPHGTIVTPTPLAPTAAVKEDWDRVISALSAPRDAKGDEAVDAALGRIRQDPTAAGDARTHVLAGLVRYSRGDAGVAEAFDAARRASKNDVPSRILAGFLHLATGAPKKAIEPLSEAAKLAPRNPAVRELLADAFLRTRQTRRAIRLLETLVVASPEAVRPRLLLSRCLIAARRPRDALAHLAKLDGHEELRFASDCLAARAHLLLGKPDAALARARNAAALRPGEVLPKTLVGTALVALDRLEEAATLTGDLVAGFPSSAAAWRLRALVCERRSEWPIALSAARRWRELAPTGTEPVLVLSRILIGAGKPDEAVPLLSAVTAKTPRVSAAHRLLGFAHLAAGRPAEARTSFETFLRAVPDGPAAEEVRKRLKELGPLPETGSK